MKDYYITGKIKANPSNLPTAAMLIEGENRFGTTDLTLTELGDTPEGVIEAMTGIREAVRQQFLAQVGPLIKKIMTDTPGLRHFAWHQYTPYFNDGEVCEPGVYADDHYLMINGMDDEGSTVGIPGPDTARTIAKKEFGVEPPEGNEDWDDEYLAKAFITETTWRKTDDGDWETVVLHNAPHGDWEEEARSLVRAAIYAVPTDILFSAFGDHQIVHAYLRDDGQVEITQEDYTDHD